MLSFISIGHSNHFRKGFSPDPFSESVSVTFGGLSGFLVRDFRFEPVLNGIGD
jgi:hypothetical protein